MLFPLKIKIIMRINPQQVAVTSNFQLSLHLMTLKATAAVNMNRAVAAVHLHLVTAVSQ
jgi:hypothetical protein